MSKLQSKEKQGLKKVNQSNQSEQWKKLDVTELNKVTAAGPPIRPFQDSTGNSTANRW